MTRLRALLLPLLLFVAAHALAAQEVRLEGAGNGRAIRLAREILAAGRYVRMDRDTVLPASFHAPGDLVVVDADVRLEGTVEGRVAVLGGALFLRPGARIGGPIAVVGGEVYRSAKATFGEVVEEDRPVQVAVEADTAGERVRIIPPEGVGTRVALPGISGIRLPTYDRANGFTLRAGPSLLFTGDEEGARIDAWVSYRTARHSFGGGAYAQTPVRGGLRASVRVARETLTNEAWARGDLENTLGSLLLGNDPRDYYESDRVVLTLDRPHDTPLIAGEYAFEPRVSLLASRDRALETRDPWSLFGDLDRPNLAIDEGTVVSASAGAGLRWQGGTSAFQGDLAVERSLPGVGDFDFTQVVGEGRWTMTALRRHQVAVYFRGMAPLGGGAPRQRWTFLGGSNTLPTFDPGDFRGDRLAYVASSYGIPFPSVVLPVVGIPTLRVTHLTGMAWRTGQPMPDWAQNLGVGIFFSLVRAEVYVDPAADRIRPQLSFGVMLPGSQ